MPILPDIFDVDPQTLQAKQQAEANGLHIDFATKRTEPARLARLGDPRTFDPKKDRIDHQKEEPERYAAEPWLNARDNDAPMQILRRLPARQAREYAVGLLAMLRWHPLERQKFAPQDLALIEALANPA